MSSSRKNTQFQKTNCPISCPKSEDIANLNQLFFRNFSYKWKYCRADIFWLSTQIFVILTFVDEEWLLEFQKQVIIKITGYIDWVMVILNFLFFLLSVFCYRVTNPSFSNCWASVFVKKFIFFRSLLVVVFNIKEKIYFFCFLHNCKRFLKCFLLQKKWDPFRTYDRTIRKKWID